MEVYNRGPLKPGDEKKGGLGGIEEWGAKGLKRFKFGFQTGFQTGFQIVFEFGFKLDSRFV